MAKVHAPFKLALLGPEKTFSDQFASTIGLSALEKIFVSSIPAIFSTFKSETNVIGLLPFENLFNGSVTSTLDGLTRVVRNSEDLEIIYTGNLQIELCVGQRESQEFSLIDAEEVYSHEQALGQAEEFLSQNCPNAILKKVESTVQGVEAASQSAKRAVAIASNEALAKYGFRTIKNVISKEQVNQTRFAIVSEKRNRDAVLKLINLRQDLVSEATFICLDPKMDRQGLLLEILDIISRKHQCNLLSINSRPDKSGGFIFYLELEGGQSELKIRDCIKDVENYCRMATGDAASCYIFGSYARQPFFKDTISTVAVIGAAGAMGEWFTNFFKARGISVLEIEVNASEAQKQKIKECQIIILSVPVTTIKQVAIEYLPYFGRGSLVVDNSSVKSESVAILESLLPTEIEIASIHTMFGPLENSLSGKNIIFVENSRSGPLAVSLERLFYKYGAIISHVALEDHDKLVAFTQGIVHFISIGFANLLADQNLTKDAIAPFLTPNSERIFLNMTRTLSQTTELVELILSGNKYSKELRNSFLDALNQVDKSVDGAELGELLKRISKKIK